mmetsp:Transcript_108807/g.340467  ORF Transcript_108807/g.340467 Transcript_108807/m.340467 type:complete len:143 (-) Transcript_108807:99-527(-)
MVPFSFMVSGGRWVPYEFIGAGCKAAAGGFQRVREHGEFLDGMASILASHGVGDILGFHILHRDHLSTEPRGSIETDGRAPGELLLRPYTDELFSALASGNGKTAQVMWSWPKMGKRLGSCFTHCNHCNHCGTHCNVHGRCH